MAFQTERERNAALMLARRFASDCNVSLRCCTLMYFILFQFMKLLKFLQCGDW
jgi:PH domain of plant-specific actin-binding protein